MKTGLFLCRCGPNIGQVVRLKELARGEDWPEAVHVVEYGILCSEEGKAWLAEEIKKHDLDRIVIAGCSPKEHEETFRGVLREAGLNPYLVQMANIREHCEWVCKDRDAATEKARDLIRAALHRVRRHEEIELQEVNANPDVVVLGAGAAGLAAALTLAQKKRNVTLIERDFVMGGLANLLDKVFPEMECASCVLEPALGQALHDDRIRILTGTEVTEVLGTFGNLTVKALRTPRHVDPEACLGCSSCADACPVVAPDAYSGGLSTRKAVYLPYAGCLPHASVVDRDRCLHFTDDSCTACQDVCPMGAIDLSGEPRTEEIPCGALILATGMGPGEREEDLPEDVLTCWQMERMLHPNGPTQGEIRCADGTEPTSVCVVLDEDRPPAGDLGWMEILKLAQRLREALPDAILRVVGRHDRPAGRWSATVKTLLDEGVMFYDGTPDAPIRGGGPGGALTVSVSVGGAAVPLLCRMVVLHSPPEPAAGTGRLAESLRVETDAHGFLESRQSLFEPVSTRVTGVHVAGCAAGPTSLSRAAEQGIAAAGRVLSRLVPGERITLEPLAGLISKEHCSGCRLCNALCPYGAIVFDADEGVSKVIAEYCRGCGTCTASCPSGASTARHFTDAQILSEIHGLLSRESMQGG